MEGISSVSVEESYTQVDLESLSSEELAEIYKDAVGINPISRMLAREVILNGIKNPEEELARLRELDKAEDNADLTNTYRQQ